MAYKNIQEAARDLAPRLAEREPRITFRLLSYTEDLSLLMPRILEEDPRLLLCVSAVRTRELGWTGGRTIALEPEYTKLLASSVSVLGLEKETEEAVEKEVEAAACQAVRFHQRGIHLSDGERGISGALDGQPKEHHLHHAHGNEVPGRQAPR